MSVQTLIKQPGESRLFSMDFSGLLAVGEDIATIDSVTADIAGLTFPGGSLIAGTFAQFRVEDGVSGIRYKITVVVTTTQGNVLEGEGILQVKDL